MNLKHGVNWQFEEQKKGEKTLGLGCLVVSIVRFIEYE